MEITDLSSEEIEMVKLLREIKVTRERIVKAMEDMCRTRIFTAPSSPADVHSETEVTEPGKKERDVHEKA